MCSHTRSLSDTISVDSIAATGDVTFIPHNTLKNILHASKRGPDECSPNGIGRVQKLRETVETYALEDRYALWPLKSNSTSLLVLTSNMKSALSEDLITNPKNIISWEDIKIPHATIVTSRKQKYKKASGRH